MTPQTDSAADGGGSSSSRYGPSAPSLYYYHQPPPAQHPHDAAPHVHAAGNSMGLDGDRAGAAALPGLRDMPSYAAEARATKVDEVGASSSPRRDFAPPALRRPLEPTASFDSLTDTDKVDTKAAAATPDEAGKPDTLMFADREGALTYAREQGRQQGFGVAILRSKNQRFWLQCDRGGRPRHRHNRASEPSVRPTAQLSRRIECPYSVVGLETPQGWMLKFVNTSHNHSMCKFPRLHYRMTPAQVEHVFQLTRAGYKPRKIIDIMARDTAGECQLTPTDIYNVRQRLRREGERENGKNSTAYQQYSSSEYGPNARGKSHPPAPQAPAADPQTTPSLFAQGSGLYLMNPAYMQDFATPGRNAHSAYSTSVPAGAMMYGMGTSSSGIPAIRPLTSPGPAPYLSSYVSSLPPLPASYGGSNGNHMDQGMMSGYTANIDEASGRSNLPGLMGNTSSSSYNMSSPGHSSWQHHPSHTQQSSSGSSYPLHASASPSGYARHPPYPTSLRAGNEVNGLHSQYYDPGMAAAHPSDLGA